MDIEIKVKHVKEIIPNYSREQCVEIFHKAAKKMFSYHPKLRSDIQNDRVSLKVDCTYIPVYSVAVTTSESKWVNKENDLFYLLHGDLDESGEDDFVLRKYNSYRSYVFAQVDLDVLSPCDGVTSLKNLRKIENPDSFLSKVYRFDKYGDLESGANAFNMYNSSNKRIHASGVRSRNINVRPLRPSGDLIYIPVVVISFDSADTQFNFIVSRVNGKYFFESLQSQMLEKCAKKAAVLSIVCKVLSFLFVAATLAFIIFASTVELMSGLILLVPFGGLHALLIVQMCKSGTFTHNKTYFFESYVKQCKVSVKPLWLDIMFCALNAVVVAMIFLLPVACGGLGE